LNKGAKTIPETVTHPAAKIVTSRRGSSRLLALIVPHFYNYFYNAIAMAAEQTARANGYTLLLGVTGEDYLRELEVVNQLMTHRVAGYMIAPVSTNSVSVETIRRVNAPLVVLERLVPQQVHQVGVNHYLLINQTVQHLVENGHRRIAYIIGDFKIPNIKARGDIFKQATDAHGISNEAAPVIIVPRTIDAGYQAVKRMLKTKPVTAIITAGYMIAEGTITGLRESGVKIPDQISVVIYSNALDWFIYNKPSFSYADLPGFEIGERAVKILIQQIEGTNPPPETLLIPGKLCCRDSVKDLTKS
jgi:DNA-binding LacI/PurR family transcriptional regulator